jgi:hypothetical protein
MSSTEGGTAAGRFAAIDSCWPQAWLHPDGLSDLTLSHLMPMQLRNLFQAMPARAYAHNSGDRCLYLYLTTSRRRETLHSPGHELRTVHN